MSAENNYFTNYIVDNILYLLDGYGYECGYVSLTGNNPPTVEGLTYKANLEAKGWEVFVDS